MVEAFQIARDADEVKQAQRAEMGLPPTRLRLSAAHVSQAVTSKKSTLLTRPATGEPDDFRPLLLMVSKCHDLATMIPGCSKAIVESLREAKRIISECV